MKRISKTILLLFICVYASVILLGCTALFDALNFNRTPLPNSPSVVEEGLVNPFPKSDDGLTKSEFEALVQATIDDKKSNFTDTLTVSFSQNLFSDAEYSYSLQLRQLDKATIIDDDPTDFDFYPYASFDYKLKSQGLLWGDSYLFFDDVFVSTEHEGNGWSFTSFSDGIKYALDEYANQIAYEPFSIANVAIEGEGLFYPLLRLVGESFVDARIDYTNGKKMHVISIDELAFEELAALVTSNFIVPSKYGNLKNVQPLELDYSEEKIDSVKLVFEFDNGTIIFDSSTRVEADQMPKFTNNYNIRASYCYAAKKQLSLLKNVMDNYFELNAVKEYKATINYNNVDFFYSFGDRAQLTFYQLANPAYDLQGYTAREMTVLVNDDETAYGASPYVYLEKNNQIEKVINGGAQYETYFAALFRMHELYNAILYEATRGNTSYFVTETDDGYEVRFHYSFTEENGSDEPSDPPYVDPSLTVSRELTIGMSSDFSTIFFVYYNANDWGNESSLVFDFDYDVSLDIPQEIIEDINSWYKIG